MKATLIATLLFAISFHGYSQDTPTEDKGQDVQKHDNVSISKKCKLAKKLAKEGSYYNAVEYYEDVYEAKSTNRDVVSELARLNEELRDYQQAAKWYARLIELDDKAKDHPLARFNYGRMLKMNGKYEEAKKELQTFLSDYEGDDNDVKSLAKAEMEGCDLAIEMMENPAGRAETLNGVNNTLQDFAPKPIGRNQMMFSALVSDTAIAVNQNELQTYYTKIFTTNRTGDSWSQRAPLPAVINNNGAHIGNGFMSKDENWLYFTQCEEVELSMKCEIYRSEKIAGEWSKPEKLGFNVGTTNTHPTLATDSTGREMIFFSADGEDGEGGMDIYYAMMEDNNNFGSAKNLGGKINTAGDEITPHYDEKKGILYFSSTGHPGIGGLDIFKVDGNSLGWREVINVGYPVNSSADDLYLALDNTGIKGYMVSNREGSISPRGTTCCDDIYGAVLEGEIWLEGIFVYKGDPTMTPVENVAASMYAVEGNAFEFVYETVTTSNPFYVLMEPGEEYKMNGSIEGAYPSVTNLTAPQPEGNDTLKKVFYLDPVVIGVDVNRVYFVFDKSTMKGEYEQTLDSLYNVMTMYPTWNLEIGGHTDSKGSDGYNQRLSERRAKAAKDYLVGKGLDKDRIATAGYGESEPIADNENPDGSDNPIGRAKNRRVEFKIIQGEDDDLEINYIDNDPKSEE